MIKLGVKFTSKLIVIFDNLFTLSKLSLDVFLLILLNIIIFLLDNGLFSALHFSYRRLLKLSLQQGWPILNDGVNRDLNLLSDWLCLQQISKTHEISELDSIQIT